MGLWVISIRTWGGGGEGVGLESDSVDFIQGVQHYSVHTTVYNSVSNINLPRHKMGSTNTTCPIISLILSAPILYYFQFKSYWKKLSFDRNLVKTIFHCPVRLHMEESKAKTSKRYSYISAHYSLFYGKIHERDIFVRTFLFLPPCIF